MHGEVYFSKKIELDRKQHSVKRGKLKESDFLSPESRSFLVYNTQEKNN